MLTKMLMNFRPLLATIVAVLALATAGACGGGEEAEEMTEGEVEWGYSGAGAPENWASLSPDYAMCGDGVKQSPVDITGYTPGDSPPLSFSFRRDAAEFANDGRFLTIS